MRTRTLHTAAACLNAIGAAMAVAGLHPRVPDIAIRAGVIVIVLSLPIIVAAQGRAADVPVEQLAAARIGGYRLGLAHAALGLLEPTDGGATTAAGTPTSYARGHLHVITDDAYERQAQ